MTYEEMMAELRTEYMRTLPERIQDIEQHLGQKDFESLSNDFHKLKGSGKTYGIPEISELGEVFEKICSQRRELALQLVPTAVSTLHLIHQARSANRPLELGSVAEFQTARKSIA